MGQSSAKQNLENKKAAEEMGKDRSEGIGLENIIYNSRFSEAEDQSREITWQILCSEFLDQWIKPSDTVIDLGAGDGKFIRNIVAKRKIAVDLSAHVNELASSAPGEDPIEVYQIAATEMAEKIDAQVDVVFMSNFLEHLPNKRILLEVLEACHQILAPNGRVIILQPNIRYVGPSYWDYVDHHIALTEHSLQEALEITGFRLTKLIPRFLPYTARSGLGWLARKLDTRSSVRAYLKLPLLWRIMGGQTFVVAEKIVKK